MGGYISAYYAIVHQENLLSLALMDAAGVTSPQKSYYQEHLEKTNENLIVPVDVEGFKKFMAVIYHIPPKVPDHFAKYFIGLRKKRLQQENRLFQEIVKSLEKPIESKLQVIETQTLIMWGDKDQVIDISSVPIFEKGIKNSQTVIFKDIGHAPFLEAPMKTNTAYKKFLTNL
jgi:pimeloyl-ACP methyl ester carboxylesterase